MFDKFGEFNSAAELNAAAKGFMDEGDYESLYALAEENGIEQETVDDYMDYVTPELASVYEAAAGKITAEAQAVGKDTAIQQPVKQALPYVAQMLRVMLFDEGEALAAAVRQKGKTVAGIVQIMFDTRCACGTDKQLQDIIRAYYLQGAEECKKTAERVRG